MFFFQVISGQQFVSGFHIQIRDMSNPEDNLYYDVVTISGGGTRSHTLSDLRPATKYAIFIMPYHKEHIIGTPSNLKMVSTKEDGKPGPGALCVIFTILVSFSRDNALFASKAKINIF